MLVDSVQAQAIGLASSQGWNVAWSALRSMIGCLETRASLTPWYAAAAIHEAASSHPTRLEAEEASCGATCSPAHSQRDITPGSQRMVLVWHTASPSMNGYEGNVHEENVYEENVYTVTFGSGNSCPQNSMHLRADSVAAAARRRSQVRNLSETFLTESAHFSGRARRSSGGCDSPDAPITDLEAPGGAAIGPGHTTVTETPL